MRFRGDAASKTLWLPLPVSLRRGNRSAQAVVNVEERERHDAADSRRAHIAHRKLSLP